MLGGLQRLLGTSAALLLAVLIGLVLINVAARAGGYGIAGIEEATIWLHLTLVAVAAPLALSGPLSMRIDALRDRLPVSLRAAAMIAADGVVAAVTLVLLSGGTAAGTGVGGMSAGLGLPEGWRFLLFAASGGLTLACLVLARCAEGKARAAAVSLALGAVLYAATLPDFAATGLSPSFVSLGAVMLAIAIGTPLAHAFLFGAALSGPFGGLLPEAALVATAVSGLSKFLLLAVPFFLLTGALLSASGAADRLVRLSASLVGHRRAGLAQTTLLTSLLFSGASGSSIANAAFGAKTFGRALIRRGHPPAEAAALVAATSVLDNVVPPSIAFLLLAAVTNLSVGSLLVGGFVAGPLMAIALAVVIHAKGGHIEPSAAKASGSERLAALRSAIPALGLGLVIVAFIRFGLVTTTEAAALAAAYCGLLGLQARMGWRDFADSLRSAGRESGAVGLLIASAAPFSYLLAVDGVAARLSDLVTALGTSPLVVLLLANLVLLGAGLFLDIGAAILLLAPILLPPVVAAGIDPVHFGVILVVNLMIHGLMPPIGILVHVVAGILAVPPAAVFAKVTPYVLALLTVLALLCLGAVLQAGLR